WSGLTLENEHYEEDVWDFEKDEKFSNNLHDEVTSDRHMTNCAVNGRTEDHCESLSSGTLLASKQTVGDKPFDHLEEHEYSELEYCTPDGKQTLNKIEGIVNSDRDQNQPCGSSHLSSDRGVMVGPAGDCLSNN